MNLKLLLKLLFMIAILLLLVLMGMHNRQDVRLALPPILPKPVEMQAAIMYFAFFAAGLLSGAILTVGGGKGGSKAVKTGK